MVSWVCDPDILTSLHLAIPIPRLIPFCIKLLWLMKPVRLFAETLALFTVLNDRVIFPFCPMLVSKPLSKRILTAARLLLPATDGKCGVYILNLNISRLFPFRKPLSWAAIIFAPLTLVSPYLVIMLQFTGNFYFPSAVFNGIPAILVVVVNKLLFIAWIDFSFICGYPIYDFCRPLPG